MIQITLRMSFCRSFLILYFWLLDPQFVHTLTAFLFRMPSSIRFYPLAASNSSSPSRTQPCSRFYKLELLLPDSLIHCKMTWFRASLLIEISISSMPGRSTCNLRHCSHKNSSKWSPQGKLTNTRSDKIIWCIFSRRNWASLWNKTEEMWRSSLREIVKLKKTLKTSPKLSKRKLNLMSGNLRLKRTKPSCHPRSWIAQLLRSKRHQRSLQKPSRLFSKTSSLMTKVIRTMNLKRTSSSQP